MQKLIGWCKRWLIPGSILFLVAFIPLYPKLPILNVNQTWTYIRLEDFVIAFLTGVLAVILFREKRIVRSPLTIPFFVYLAVGFVSLVNALVFIFPHFGGLLYPQVAVFHYFRRVEYFMAFFVAVEAVRERRILKPLVWILVSTVFLVALYGFGQKFLGFPAFLTMNEEFAKGVPLRLPSNARFPSTFGGHYDVAAYLVLTIPIVASLIFAVRRWYLRIVLFLVSVAGLVMLLFTASRTSFVVYLVAMSAMLWWQKKKLLIVPVIILSVLIMNFTSGASERFYKTFRMSDVVVDLSTGKPIGTLEKVEGQGVTIAKSQSPAQETLPTGSEFINVPGKAATTEEQTAQTVTMYKSKDIATSSGEMATISGSFLIQKALVYDISITTRLQAEWPKAIDAFKRNILLGSGYSALSVAADGDYHRMLGETGLLGTISFLGIFLYSFYLFFRKCDKLPPLERAFVVGLFGGFVGLLMNAILIDVFEASKVAFSFYLLLGVGISLLATVGGESESYARFMRNFFTDRWMQVAYLIAFVWGVWWKSLSVYFIGDDFTWLRWAAESNVKDIVKYFTVATGFFYRPIPKLWNFALFSVFWLKPTAYHIASLALVSATVIVMIMTALKRKVPLFLAIFAAAFFAVMSVHHENVFWISGQSSLLAGFFFAASVYLLSLAGSVKGKVKFAAMAGSLLSLVLCMGSYDAMVVAPVAYLIVAYFVYGYRGKIFGVLALPVLYWIVRSSSGAVPAAGDYGYKLTTLPVNLVVNTVSYFVSMVVGPRALDVSMALRASLRGNQSLVLALIALLVVVAGILVVKLRKRMTGVPEWVVYVVAAVVLGVGFSGLGGVADRYAYIPSVMVVMGVSVLLRDVWEKRGYVPKIVLFAFLAAAIAWNALVVQSVGQDWLKAGTVVDQTLLSIKKETFPPKNEKTFVFVNVPIRYGRAWIFPTGLEDSIWHMYRESPFTIRYVKTLDEAFSQQYVKGDLEVFVFDNYVVKRGVREAVAAPASGKKP